MLVQPGDMELLTPGEVAALLFVDPKTVARWAAAGKLVAIRTPGGHRRYLKSDVVAIMSRFGAGGPGRTAADAARAERRARGRAAEIAAQTVARVAVSAAASAESRAGVVAAQAKDAADRAVADLILSIEVDGLPTVSELSRRLVATARAAADATTLETQRAATEVADAVATAAYWMTRTVDAAEVEVDESATR